MSTRPLFFLIIFCINIVLLVTTNIVSLSNRYKVVFFLVDQSLMCYFPFYLIFW